MPSPPWVVETSRRFTGVTLLTGSCCSFPAMRWRLASPLVLLLIGAGGKRNMFLRVLGVGRGRQWRGMGAGLCRVGVVEVLPAFAGSPLKRLPHGSGGRVLL